MPPLLFLAITICLILLLAVHRSTIVAKRDKIMSSLNRNINGYKNNFGTRADARQFIKIVTNDAKRIEGQQSNIDSIIGLHVGRGDIAGAALIGVGKVAINGVAGLLGKISDNLGKRAIARDGEKSQEQARYEEVIILELHGFLESRRLASRLKSAMWIIGAIGGFASILAHITQPIT